VSRRRNFNEPRHAHELTFSCYQGYPFLKSERTCTWLSEALAEARRDCGFALWAYVFMPEHVHLIVSPRQKEYEIAAIRQAIKEPVGRKGVAFLKAESPDWLQRITSRNGIASGIISATRRRIRPQYY
jgi:putative transposase